MNNSTNNKIVPIHLREDDFKAIHQMLNTPKQEARRLARRKQDRNYRFWSKALHTGGAFLAGMAFMYLLIHLV